MKNLQRGQGLIEYSLILVLIAVVIIVIGAIFFDAKTDSQDVYEQAYDRCIARESISAERCHDIALMEAYPNNPTIIPYMNP